MVARNIAKYLILKSHWTSSSTKELFIDVSGRDGWGGYWEGRWISAHWSRVQRVLPGKNFMLLSFQPIHVAHYGSTEKQ